MLIYFFNHAGNFSGDGRIITFIPAHPLILILTIGLGIFFTRFGIQLLVSKKQWIPRYDVYIRPKLWKVYVKLTSIVYLILGPFAIFLCVYTIIVIWLDEIYLEVIYLLGFLSVWSFLLSIFAIFIWIGLKIVGISLFIRELIQRSGKDKESEDDIT